MATEKDPDVSHGASRPQVILPPNLPQLTAEDAVARLLKADLAAESVALLDGVEAGRKAAHPQLGEVVAQPAAALENDDGNSDKHSLLQVPQRHFAPAGHDENGVVLTA